MELNNAKIKSIILLPNQLVYKELNHNKNVVVQNFR